ncbi:MAG: pyruvate kinase [Gracilimonas sp.]|uniref:pyruvate kinase n=1 Tax=Gracilimonas TaxID=649462 RepID=UPI001B19657A|nr:pyruvate kinase [Gracilimonas sp.]MBO6585833.1 pyruvate kinase [Gracilimonas sp.]MBO6616830.1 pyruvate kinase [Gracilimonas sp.]
MISARRRTKIVCTIGPSCNTLNKIEELLLHGMNVARVNFSHGTHEDHAKVIKHIRKTAKKYEYSVPVLMDLQGPKIRVGQMKNGGVELETGSIVKITGEDVTGDSSVIPIDYKNLLHEAEVGNSILLDDGLLEFKVIEKKPDSLQAKVVIGGELKSRKGVNLPNVRISIPSLTEKDLKDLEFGIKQDVDLIALSFVRSAKDVRDIISRVRAAGSQAAIIAKIEKPEALDVIDEIIEEADGIMVARGDLGIEIPTEQVPIVQKMIIEKCRMAGKPVITATQMLDSMINNPRPTRAESSDVANAVLDGTDAVMLSGETAAGKYPMEAVNVMDRICRSVEEKRPQIYNSLGYRKPEWKEKQIIESLAYSCVTIADNVEAKAISTITHSGNTARRIAKFRPKVPIVAFTESKKVRRQLNLVWGVYSVRLDELFDTDRSVRMMENYLHENGMVKNGDRVIVATGMPIAKRGRTNMIKVSTIE